MPLIAEHFLTKYTREMGKPIAGFTPDGDCERLQAYPWPGNVRELENVIERAVALEATDRIQPETLGDPFWARPAVGRPVRPQDRQRRCLPAPGFNLEQHLQDIERTHVERALRRPTACRCAQPNSSASASGSSAIWPRNTACADASVHGRYMVRQRGSRSSDTG